MRSARVEFHFKKAHREVLVRLQHFILQNGLLRTRRVTRKYSGEVFAGIFLQVVHQTITGPVRPAKNPGVIQLGDFALLKLQGKALSCLRRAGKDHQAQNLFV